MSTSICCGEILHFDIRFFLLRLLFFSIQNTSNFKNKSNLYLPVLPLRLTHDVHMRLHWFSPAIIMNNKTKRRKKRRMDNCFVKKPISDSIRTTDRTRRFLICLLFFDYIEIRKKHIYWYMRTNNICAYHHHPKTIKISADTYVMSQTFFFFFSRINPSSCSNNEREKSEIIKFVTLPIKKSIFAVRGVLGNFFDYLRLCHIQCLYCASFMRAQRQEKKN